MSALYHTSQGLESKCKTLSNAIAFPESQSMLSNERGKAKIVHNLFQLQKESCQNQARKKGCKAPVVLKATVQGER